MVLRALRLLAGIFLRHSPEQSRISEPQIATVLMWKRKVSAGERKWPRSDRNRHCCLYKRSRSFLHPIFNLYHEVRKEIHRSDLMSVPSFHGFTITLMRKYIRLVQCLQGSLEYESRLGQDEIRLEVSVRSCVRTLSNKPVH